MLSKYAHILKPGLSKATLGLAGLLAAAVSAQAQVVSILDNYEAGTNQNKFLGYTYFYTDAADGGTSKVNSAAPGTGTELLFDPIKSVDVGANGSTKSAKLDFTYGANMPKGCAGTCPYGQMVGMGTEFTPGSDAGKVLNMTGGTSITFWAKSSVAMKIRVEVTTKTVTGFGFHRAEFPITPTWSKYSFMLTEGLGGLARPAWAVTPIAFDITQTQKLQFQISAEDNVALTAGTLWLDDITVEGYSWVPPNACVPCVGAQGAGTGLLLSDLEPPAIPTGRAANQNAAGGFWYAYNDAEGRTVTAPSEYSEIFEGVDLLALDPKVPVFKPTPGKGAALSQGAYIKAQLGPTFLQNAASIQPFVGLGTKTSDNLLTSFLDGSTSTGISFDYWTDSTSKFKFIRLEAKANQDLGTNKGVVHHVLLPATGGVWKSATVPWDKLVLPDWTDAPPLALNPFKRSAIEKFQWAIQDAPGTTGAMAIDNVKIMGVTSFGVGINSHRSAKADRGLSMSQIAGRIQVSYTLPQGVDAGVLSLVDLKGSVMASRNLAGKGLQQATLDTQGLRSGVYSLQVRHGNSSESMPVTLLK